MAAIINHFPEVPGSAVTYKCAGSPVVVKSKKKKKKKKSAFPQWYSRPDDIKLKDHVRSQGEKAAQTRILIRISSS